MGLSGIGPIELLVILAIVIMLFGTKRLRNLGGDLGSALKGFKKAMHEGDDESRREHDDRVVEQVEQQDQHQQQDTPHRTHHNTEHS